MPRAHTVIDIFAGPGGLSEGFSGLMLGSGHRPFHLGVSAEMEASAHATLSLRALYRKSLSDNQDTCRAYWNLVTLLSANPSANLAEAATHAGLATQLEEVRHEALRITLGTREGNQRLKSRLLTISKSDHDGLVLIGGPPCQAYSLVGRARNRGIRGYRPEHDSRHFLYEEYLSILGEFRPDVFIMENVKGILSSRVAGTRMFERILDDLQRPSGKHGPKYDLIPLAPEDDLGATESLWPSVPDFVIRSEHFGIPQSRHRVIILGIRRGAVPSAALASARLSRATSVINVKDVLSDLPKLRSGLSRCDDSGSSWADVMVEQQARLVRSLRKSDPDLANLVGGQTFSSRLTRSSIRYRPTTDGPVALRQHYRNRRLKILPSHATRGHMKEDLCRYLFCASYAALYGRSPSSSDFPDALKPSHKSWDKGHFADRFRVQLGRAPGNTVTSHLAKDGHHFIHWDAEQCRSLTVREAARIQTFPDDYLFLGNRTQQYTQVGNAVPPLLARQIAAVVAKLLG